MTAPVPPAEQPEGAICPDCGHHHTPDGCVGQPTPSDRWAGVSPVVCDCGVWDGETAEQPEGAAGDVAELTEVIYGILPAGTSRLGMSNAAREVLTSDWLARHVAQAEARALREAADRWERGAYRVLSNALDLEVADRVVDWLRDRADRKDRHA